MAELELGRRNTNTLSHQRDIIPWDLWQPGWTTVPPFWRPCHSIYLSRRSRSPLAVCAHTSNSTRKSRNVTLTRQIDAQIYSRAFFRFIRSSPSSSFSDTTTSFYITFRVRIAHLGGRRRSRLRGVAVVNVVSVRRHLRQGAEDEDAEVRGRGQGRHAGLRQADDSERDVHRRRGRRLPW